MYKETWRQLVTTVIKATEKKTGTCLLTRITSLTLSRLKMKILYMHLHFKYPASMVHVANA